MMVMLKDGGNPSTSEKLRSVGDKMDVPLLDRANAKLGTLRSGDMAIGNRIGLFSYHHTGQHTGLAEATVSLSDVKRSERK